MIGAGDQAFGLGVIQHARHRRRGLLRPRRAETPEFIETLKVLVLRRARLLESPLDDAARIFSPGRRRRKHAERRREQQAPSEARFRGGRGRHGLPALARAGHHTATAALLRGLLVGDELIDPGRDGVGLLAGLVGRRLGALRRGVGGLGLAGGRVGRSLGGVGGGLGAVGGFTRVGDVLLHVAAPGQPNRGNDHGEGCNSRIHIVVLSLKKKRGGE
jgi:hypothetical protein